MVLEGKTPSIIHPFPFGATLVTMEKKRGEVMPIAMGCTIHRLMAKIAGSKVVGDMAKLLAPQQLGYGTSGGVEAAVHAARLYLSQL